ncbi:MAG: universal stress protein [Halorhodospira sp.]
MQRILFATDLTDRAAPAAQQALSLAVAHGAELRVLHTIEADLEEETLERIFQGQGQGAAQALTEGSEERIRAQMQAAGAGDAAGYEIRCRWGQPHAEIAAEAQEWQPSLVVLGVHGQRVLRDLFLGSTVERLAHHLARPILVVKAERPAPYRRVLIPVDGSERSRQAVAAADRLAPQAELQLLSVFDSTGLARALGTGEGSRAGLAQLAAAGREEREEQLEGFVADMARPQRIARYEVRSGYPGQVILEVASEWGADLVAMGTRGLSRWEGALLGSVARRAAHELEQDVLLVPEAR